MTHPAKNYRVKELDKQSLERLAAVELARMQRVRSSLILNHPFFGQLAHHLRPQATLFMMQGDKLIFMTCATDGQKLYYNPLWTASISDAELLGVYCHEILHCALRHMFRRAERDPMKWNVACDGAINRLLRNIGIKLPDGGVDRNSFDASLTDEQFNSFSAEQLYHHVKQDGGGQSGKGDEFIWGSVLDAPAQAENGDTQADQEAKWRVSTIQAANNAKLQGKLPGDLEQLVHEVTRNKIDWKSYLRKFLQSTMANDYDWRRPSTRYIARGLYMPSMHDEKVPPIVVVSDTSGSCWNDQQKFFSELRSILEEVKPEAVHFMQVDAGVADYQVLQPEDEIKLTVHGGGGTSFVPPFEKVKELGITPAAFIYLTDLYGDFPDQEPDYPVLWASTTLDKEAPFGQTLYLGDD